MNKHDTYIDAIKSILSKYGVDGLEKEDYEGIESAIGELLEVQILFKAGVLNETI